MLRLSLLHRQPVWRDGLERPMREQNILAPGEGEFELRFARLESIDTADHCFSTADERFNHGPIEKQMEGGLWPGKRRQRKRHIAALDRVAGDIDNQFPHFDAVDRKSVV